MYIKLRSQKRQQAEPSRRLSQRLRLWSLDNSWLSRAKLQSWDKMRPPSLYSILVPFFLWSLTSAASWGFDDASVSIDGKKAGVGGGAQVK